jgi:hypothetical protein
MADLSKPDQSEQLPLVGSEDIRRLFRHADDHTVAAILALRPTLAQLEEAETRTTGTEDIFAALRPAEGVVARIIELVGMEEDEFEEGRSSGQ